MSSLRRLGLEVEGPDGDGRCNVLLSGELDIATAPRVRRAITRTFALGRTRTLMLDMSRLEFIDSSGLAAIMHAGSLCERSGCELALIRGPDAVHRVFEVSGLASELPFRET
jgi:anti-sigma B factor antagonist